MKTISLKLYSYQELSKEAQEKAHAKWNEYNDMPFLGEYLRDIVTQQFDQAGYHAESLEIFYSLSHSQGDGVSFSGTLTRKDSDKTWHLNKNSHQYQHAYTMDVYVEDADGEIKNHTVVTDKMRAIARKSERLGYAYIDAEMSEENFAEACAANEYMFEENGKMRNA